MAHRLKIPGVLQARAAFEPATFDAEKNTVEIVWTTGARGLRYSWDGPFYEELEVSERAIDLSRLNNGAPFMDDHPYRRGEGGTRSVLGVVEKAWLVGPAGKKEGRALIRFSDREDVKPIVRDIQNGILRHTSVGYSIQKMEKVEEVDKVPVLRATRWTPHEISQTPIAFDDAATVRSRPEQEFHEVEITSAAQETRAMPNETTPTTPAAAAPAPERLSAVEEAIRSAKAARLKEKETVAEASVRAAEEARSQERERQLEIRKLVRRTSYGDALADDLIAKDVSIEEVRKIVLDRLADGDEATPTEQHTRIGAGDDARDKRIRGLSAWLYQKAGVAGVMERAQKAMPSHSAFRDIALDPGEFRGMSLLDVARECLEAAGVKTRGYSKQDVVGHALTFRSSHGFNTTSDFAVILENTLHKLLLASYAVTPDTWAMFCYRGSVSDFRPHNRYRLGSFGTLDSLNEHGEFKQKAIPDAEKQLISATTKGNIISLSRQAIINDDMSAFSRLATMLGRAAKLSIEVDVYALLALNSGLGPTMGDGLTLYHATHANVGTGAAISAASIYADRVVLASQKDPSKNEILDLRPHCLCVPVGLGGDARVINEAQYDPDTVNKLQRPNYSRGFFNVICDTPRLAGTRRYMFADPNVAPVIEVAFLDGQSEPFLDVMNGWRVDGVDWKVRLDYGVGPIDFRGTVTNAGV